jgi:hypothetical protein
MSYSSSLGLTLPAVGSLINSWGPVANTNYSIIDQGINGVLTLSVAGNTNVTLTSTAGATNQANNAIYEFTGALTGSITVFVPATTRKFTVYNNTSGAFTLTVAVVGTPGSTIAVVQGQINPLWSDGTNIFSGHTGIATVPSAGLVYSTGSVMQPAVLQSGITNTSGTITLGNITPSSVSVSNATTASATSGPINYGTLGFSDTGVVESLQTSVNSFLQAVIQNTNSGTLASADFIVGNNLSTATTFYGDFGMNSSGFTGTGSMNLANAVYFYSVSGDLVLGTQSANAIHIVANTAASDAITVSSANVVSLNGQSITLAGPLTTAGAFPLTLTQTGTTSVTLPTSGTLVNSAVTTLSSLTSVGTIGTGVWQGTLIGGTYGGTGVNNGASTISVGGSVAFSGAFGFTGTVTGTTSVTFPTSGTLATTAGLNINETFTGGLISVAGSPVNAGGTLALTVAGTSGGVPYFNSATSWATSAALTSNGLVLGGGAGTAPVTNSNFRISAGTLEIGQSGTIGVVQLFGNTSGTITITPQATAGTATFTLPNTSGTFAVSVPSPLTLSATTGAISWTGLTQGGLLYASTTTAVSSTGTYATGNVLVGAAGSPPSASANVTTTNGTLTLGQSGTIGAVQMLGNTSGTITVTPQATAGTATFHPAKCKWHTGDFSSLSVNAFSDHRCGDVDGIDERGRPVCASLLRPWRPLRHLAAGTRQCCGAARVRLLPAQRARWHLRGTSQQVGQVLSP